MMNNVILELMVDLKECNKRYNELSFVSNERYIDDIYWARSKYTKLLNKYKHHLIPTDGTSKPLSNYEEAKNSLYNLSGYISEAILYEKNKSNKTDL